MSQPPRRSRPKRPGQTIDLKAERSGTVGYAGPVSSPAVGEDETPEDRLAETATTLPGAADEAAAPAEPGVEAVTPVADTATPVADAATPGPGAGTGETTLRDFAEDEGLADPAQRERAAEEFEDETILAAAAPDQAAREAAAAAKPSYDYHAASALTQPEHRGGGFGTALGAGLLGALIAFAGAGAAQYAGLLPSLSRQDPAELSQQFASLGDVQQVTADFATLREDVERLKSAQAAGGAGVGATTADLNAVADRVTAIEQRASQAPAPEAGIDQGDVDALRTAAENARRLAEEAKRAADEAAGAVSAIRQTAEGAASTAGNAQSVAGNAVQATETAQQTATTAQAAATAAQQAATTAQATAGAANSAIAALEPRIAAMEATSRRAAVSIAAASLKSAIDEGTPFMGQLERFAQVAGASPAVETLRGFAASGVPSKASLAAAWPEVERSIAAALRPAPAAGDVGGAVLSGLSALVTVRPSGPAPASAEGADAALSRLSAAIAGGDLRGFLAEWDKLPEAGKTASADFQARVKARAEAEQVIGETLDSAVEAVGTAG